MTNDELRREYHAALLNIMAIWPRKEHSAHEAGELMYQIAAEALAKGEKARTC